MQESSMDLKPYLSPTEFIESDAPAIKNLAESLKRSGERETAVALFNWVRDEIRYDPFAALDDREMYRATAILERRRGYCVQKAVLLAALGRAAGIPCRLGFADVRNHKTPRHLLEIMGTNLYVFHGYVELFLDCHIVNATPPFDPDSTRKAGALLVELDGTNDAMLHPVDPQGHPFIEYVRYRGSFVDLPYDELQQAFLETYASHSRLGPTRK